MIVLLGFAFLAGLVTILAPCIWPLLPIVLSASATGKSHTRPLGITLGIITSFTFFTLGISYLVRLFHFDPNYIRIGAVFVLIFLGLSLIIPALSRLTESVVSKLSGKFGRTGQNTGSDFGSGFLTGLTLGIVWAPCAGPILASIATLGATGQVNAQVLLVTLFYMLGVGIPLFLFAYGGQKVVAKTRFLSKHTGRVQQVFGVLMLLTALAIYTNYDKVIQLALLDALPSYSSALTSFESNDALKKQLDSLKQNATNTITLPGGNKNTPAPEFTGITHWLNLPAGKTSLKLADLKGKVVLVDFWTYTCINCIRTLPHITSWYEKYKDAGFVVVGVHTPEFAFEHDTSNVQNAIKQYHITYPVAQDNDYMTWNAYANQYWPAHYLIDAKGVIRETHFGEGAYEDTEKAIQALLAENGKKVTAKIDTMTDDTPHQQISPETYLGSDRMQYYYPSNTIESGTKQFTLAQNPDENTFSLGGTWTIGDHQATTGENATLTYHFTAQKVFLVLRPGMAKTPVTVHVLLDGKSIAATAAGSDVHNGTITIDTDRLYNLVDLKDKTETHILKLEFDSPGTEVFAFTFG